MGVQLCIEAVGAGGGGQGVVVRRRGCERFLIGNGCGEG